MAHPHTDQGRSRQKCALLRNPFFTKNLSVSTSLGGQGPLWFSLPPKPLMSQRMSSEEAGGTDSCWISETTWGLCQRVPVRFKSRGWCLRVFTSAAPDRGLYVSGFE